MYTSSISSCQICQDVDPTVAESQGQPQPESSKTTYSEQRFDLRALRPPCDKTKLVFQKSQGQCQSRRASANQGQEKLSVVTPALIFIRKSDSRHDRSWRQARKVLRALAGGGFDAELLKCFQTSTGVAWQEASCQDDLSHPNCRHEAQKPQAEIWEQRLLLTNCLRVMYVNHTVWQRGLRAGCVW